MNRTNGHVVIASPRDDHTAAANFAHDAHRAVSTALKRARAAGQPEAAACFGVALCAIEDGQQALAGGGE